MSERQALLRLVEAVPHSHGESAGGSHPYEEAVQLVTIWKETFLFMVIEYERDGSWVIFIDGSHGLELCVPRPTGRPL
jgi:hypothetical protein